MNSTAQGFSFEDTITDDSYFNISEIKLLITSLFSVLIMSYLRALDIIYSDVIDSYISVWAPNNPGLEIHSLQKSGHS